MNRTILPSCPLMEPVKGLQGESHREGEQTCISPVQMETVPRKEVGLGPEGCEVVSVWNPFDSAVSLEPDVKVMDATEVGVGVSLRWKWARDDAGLAGCSNSGDECTEVLCEYL